MNSVIRWFCAQEMFDISIDMRIFRFNCQFIFYWKVEISSNQHREKKMCFHLKLVEIWFLLSISCWQTWYANNKWCWQNANRVYSAFISISMWRANMKFVFGFGLTSTSTRVSWFENFISIYVFRWKSIMSTLINPIA